MQCFIAECLLDFQWLINIPSRPEEFSLAVELVEQLL